MLAVHSQHPVVIDWPGQVRSSVDGVHSLCALYVLCCRYPAYRSLSTKQPAFEKFLLLLMMSDCEGLAMGECGVSEELQAFVFHFAVWTLSMRTAHAAKILLRFLPYMATFSQWSLSSQNQDRFYSVYACHCMQTEVWQMYNELCQRVIVCTFQGSPSPYRLQLLYQLNTLVSCVLVY